MSTPSSNKYVAVKCLSMWGGKSNESLSQMVIPSFVIMNRCNVYLDLHLHDAGHPERVFPRIGTRRNRTLIVLPKWFKYLNLKHYYPNIFFLGCALHIAAFRLESDTWV